jgi:hypothetical protein
LKNAEVHGIAKAPAPGDHVLAQRTFFLRTKAKYRLTGTLVQGVCFRFDAKAIPSFEGVLEHQVFCFGVDDRSLPRLANKRQPISTRRLLTSMFRKRVLPIGLPEAMSIVAKGRMYVNISAGVVTR